MKKLDVEPEFEDSLELSIKERMNFAVKNFRWLFRISLALAIVILVLSIAGLAVYWSMSELLQGVPIQAFVENSTAEKAGLEKGDVIMYVDDFEIFITNDFQMTENNVFAEDGLQSGFYEPGDVVTVTVFREGQNLSFPVTIMPSLDRPEIGMLGIITHFEANVAKAILTSLENIAIFSAIVSGGFLIWALMKGFRPYSDAKKIIKEYTFKEYQIAVGLTDRDLEEEVTLDFYDNIARNVFPEVKEADSQSIKDNDEEKEIEEIVIKNKKNGDYTYEQVELENGIFVMKKFEKKISFEELNELVNTVNKKEGTKCFRLVCLANDYDQDVLQRYSEIRKIAPPTDLILFNDKGFSMLDISEKIH